MEKAFLILFFSIIALSSYAQSERKTAVAVMDLRGSGISAIDAKFLTDRLMIELQRTDVFDVLERDKIGEILKEQGFQQTGACDQTSCLVEAGRLLPVEKMIGGSVGKFGETFSVQVRLIDLKTAKVEKTATKDFSQKMDYLLTNGMQLIAYDLAEKNNNKKYVLVHEKIIPDSIAAKYKSSSLAAISSFIVPGSGQYYIGKYKMGSLFLISEVGLGLTAMALRAEENWTFEYMAVISCCVMHIVNTSTAVYYVKKHNENIKNKYNLGIKFRPKANGISTALSMEF